MMSKASGRDKTNKDNSKDKDRGARRGPEGKRRRTEASVACVPGQQPRGLGSKGFISTYTDLALNATVRTRPQSHARSARGGLRDRGLREILFIFFIRPGGAESRPRGRASSKENYTGRIPVPHFDDEVCSTRQGTVLTDRVWTGSRIISCG